MKTITRKLASLSLVATTLCGTLLLPGVTNSKSEISAATAGSTYSGYKAYYLSDKNCGFYTEPDEPGTYKTAILLHGNGETCSSWMAQQMPKAMQYWTQQGYLEPMVLFMPWVGYNPGTDPCGVMSHREFGEEYADDLADSIGNIAGKADTKKSIAIAGYSMGGCDALTAAAKYNGLFKEVGSLSSSFTFYKHDNPDDPWSTFHSTKGMDFSQDLNCYITYGRVEAETDPGNIFKPSAKCYYSILTQKLGLKNVVGPYEYQNGNAGGHGNRLFLREIFMYLYYLQTGKVCPEDKVEAACSKVYLDKDKGEWKELKKPAEKDHNPSKKDDPVTTPLTVSDTVSSKTKVTFGDPYTLSVTAQGGNSANYTYNWQYRIEGQPYRSTERKDKDGNSLNGKSTLPIADATRDIYYRCVVSDGTTTVYSKPVFISVAPRIKSITSEGKGKSLVPDATYKIKVVAEGQNLEYKWEYSLNGTDWIKSTNSGYDTDTATYINKKEFNVQVIYYRCTVTSAATSAQATIRLGK